MECCCIIFVEELINMCVVRDQEMVSILSDQWQGLARASVEQEDPVIPISQVDWSSMTSVVYDPLHAFPSIARRDRIRIFLSHLMSMDGRVFILAHLLVFCDPLLRQVAVSFI